MLLINLPEHTRIGLANETRANARVTFSVPVRCPCAILYIAVVKQFDYNDPIGGVP